MSLGTVKALSDNDYQVRSFESFDVYMYSSSLLFGIDSDSYNYVALEPLNYTAINGTNCNLWMAREYGGHFYFYAQENATVQINESVDAVRINGVPYSDGDIWHIIENTGNDVEWSYTLAPLIPMPFLFGMVGLVGCFVLPLYMIKKLKEHDIDTAVTFAFIGLCVCIALLVGWLWV